MCLRCSVLSVALQRVFTTPMYVHNIQPPGTGEQFFLRDVNLVAGVEPRARVVMRVDGSRGDAVGLAGHRDVAVTGHGDAVSRVDGVIIYGLGRPRGEIR